VPGISWSARTTCPTTTRASPVTRSEIDALVRHGLLDGEKRDDITAIRAAFHQYLDRTLGLC
jgi:hypothetical protein